MNRDIDRTVFFLLLLLLAALLVPGLSGAAERSIVIDFSHGQSGLKNLRMNRSQDYNFEMWEQGFSRQTLQGSLETGRYPLVILFSPAEFFNLEEKRVLGRYLSDGGAILLAAGGVREEEYGSTEIDVLNDLLNGLAEEGFEAGFRFESTPLPGAAGMIIASDIDDPIIRGLHGEVRELELPQGFALDIDSFLNPLVRAFTLGLPSGDKWPFLAVAVAGSGKIAAIGSGGSLLERESPGDEEIPRGGGSDILVKNLLSWLLGEREYGQNGDEYRSSVIINEIMWGGDPDREYIELFNTSGDNVRLEGWTVTDGEDVYILGGSITPHGYYLLEYREEATPVMSDEVYGDDSPHLVFEDDGDHLSLLDRWGNLITIVNREESRWPAGYSEGHGASMELINERGDLPDPGWRNSVGGDHISYGTPRAVNSTKVIAPFVPDFRASIANGTIILEWSIDKDLVVSHFNLYRSVDASFNPLEGTGTFIRINAFPIPPDSTRFVDVSIDSGLTYHYLLGVLSEQAVEEFSQPVTICLQGLEEPKRFSVIMDQNFPNPFNPQTEIHFEIEDLEESGKPIEINVCLFSPRGRMVRRLFEKQTYPGSFSVRWDGRDDNGEEVGSGAYYYQLLVRDAETGQALVRLSRKMVLMR